MNLLSKVYSPHHLQGLHLQGMSVWSDFKWSFLTYSLIIKRLTLLLVVVAAKTKRARKHVLRSNDERQRRLFCILISNDFYLFLNKFTEAEQKCYVHCIIVPHKPPPGESADFCLYLCHARIVSVIELQCVRDFSTSSYWWLFSARASQILRGCSWVCKSHSVVSAAGISCVPHCMTCCPGNCPPRINICSISRPLASVKVTSEMHHGKPRRTPGRSREEEGFTIIIPHHTRSRKLRPRMRLVFSLTELTN